MERRAARDILNWKDDPRRKPLIIRGARQVGKTWLVDNVLAQAFETYAKIDLEKRRDLHTYFAESLDPHQILTHLELSAGRIVPGKTLLFLDEIQACPNAIAALRYFYEEVPDLHVIAAGSLLELALSTISMPVGRVQYLLMQPMTFHEYLTASGKDVLAEYSLLDPASVSPSIQEAILGEVKHYFFVGGMPESVKAYVETGSVLESFRVQSEIMTSYRDDFSKYFPRVNPSTLDTVLLHTAMSVGDQIKYTRLSDTTSSQVNKNALELLIKARLVHKIPSCNPPGLPLGATANQKKFKAAFLDIGLMQNLCGLPVERELRQEDLLSIYQGKLAEQFVAQELIAWHAPDLHYWARESRGSNAEVDYLVSREGQVYPVEVKSGRGGSLRSLHLMLQSYPEIPQGLVMYSDVYKELPEQKIVFAPLYAVQALAGSGRNEGKKRGNSYPTSSNKG